MRARSLRKRTSVGDDFCQVFALTLTAPSRERQPFYGEPTRNVLNATGKLCIHTVLQPVLIRQVVPAL